MSISRGSAAGQVDLLDGFVGYLRRERGVSELTVDAYVSDVRRFLADRGGGELGGLTAAEVSKAVLAQVDGRSPASVRRFGCGPRSFLRYCYVSGVSSTTCPRPCCRCRGGDAPCCPKASHQPKPRRCSEPAIAAAPGADVTTR